MCNYLFDYNNSCLRNFEFLNYVNHQMCNYLFDYNNSCLRNFDF